MGQVKSMLKREEKIQEETEDFIEEFHEVLLPMRRGKDEAIKKR